jgi:hypothetical protein
MMFGQSANFFADTTLAWRDAGQNQKEKELLMEMEWRINGQTLHFGSKPIEIKINQNKTDTLFYKQNNKAQWDTIICKINEPKTYKFIYNTCCGGFDIADERGRIFGQVNFKIEGQANKRVYLGTLGEVGLIVKTTTTDTLRPGCRSAMSPNIYQLKFSEIEICKDTSSCFEGTCLYEKGKNELNYDFGYRTISKKINFLFMPLSRKPIQIIYNSKTDKIKIE